MSGLKMVDTQSWELGLLQRITVNSEKMREPYSVFRSASDLESKASAMVDLSKTGAEATLVFYFIAKNLPFLLEQPDMDRVDKGFKFLLGSLWARVCLLNPIPRIQCGMYLAHQMDSTIASGFSFEVLGGRLLDHLLTDGTLSSD